jgi:hypothetical protein
MLLDGRANLRLLELAPRPRRRHAPTLGQSLSHRGCITFPRPIATQLTTDRGRMTTEGPADRCLRIPLSIHRRYDFALFDRNLVIGHRWDSV